MKKTVRFISLIISLIMLSGGLAAFAGAEDAGEPFIDVGDGDWFSESVKYVKSKGLMEGTGRFVFDPEGKLTRAMAVTILYRLSGEPGTAEGSSFSDVPENTWYTAPVSWARKQGVVKGRTKTEFDPDGEIIRAEFAAMLSRYIAAEDKIVYEEREGDPADISAVPDYAKESVTEMYRAGIINGRENGAFDPEAKITRSETAAMIERYDKKSSRRIIEDGVLRNNGVTLGWVINALYKIEGEPVVRMWTPFYGKSYIAIYAPDDPEWARQEKTRRFWNTEFPGKWYRDALIWAHNSYLYLVSENTDPDYVKSDFEDGEIFREELIDVLFRYCRRSGIKLPKVRDYPGFDDVDEVYYDLDSVAALYEAGVVDAKGEGFFGIDDVVRYDEAVSTVERLAAVREASMLDPDRPVPVGILLTALYGLEGEPDVTDYCPCPESDLGAEDPEKAQAAVFWLRTVKDKPYRKPLMWAINNSLYYSSDIEKIDSDFTTGDMNKRTFVRLIAKYCGKSEIALPKTRDFPGFDDLSEFENADPDLISVYEAGLIREAEEGRFGYNEGRITLAQAEAAVLLLRELKNGE